MSGYETEALASTSAAVRAASGSKPSSVRVLLLGRDGRLRIAAAYGREDRGGRMRSKRRRAVLQTGRPARVELSRLREGQLLMLPLLAEGRSLGLIEVVTAAPEVLERIEVLEAVASQAAATIFGARERATAELELRVSEATLALARELLRARTARAAVRAAADHTHEYLGAPTIGLLWDGQGDGWEVVRIRGFGTRRRAELRASIGADGWRGSRQPPRGGRSSLHPPTGELRRLSEVVASVTHLDQVQARRAGPALLFALGAPTGARRFLAGAASLLVEAFEQLDAVDRARILSQDLDLGIAWTAHELRAPLVGARQAIEHVLDSNGSPAAREDMLRQTRRELSDLADLVDPLLRWPSGRRGLPRSELDLAALVREAVDLCCRGEPGGRVRVRAQHGVMVRGHATGLRTAVANLVRNALVHSPPQAVVDVRVGSRKGAATVVVSDQGPGVRERDRERLLDPSAYGPPARGRDGHGLGLSIVKRIVEAHGGAVGLDSGPRGSRFWIELPAAEERRHRSAS